MKKTPFLLLAVALFAQMACKKEQANQGQLPKINALAANSPNTTYEYATDSSGTVQIVVVNDHRSGLGNSMSVTIPNDYVLIGGGGFAYGGSERYLTTSYPDDSLTTWSTKFFITPRLTNTFSVYAVGLKLAGLTKAQLKANIQLFSGVDSASVGSDYSLIGGGTKVTYNGNGQSLVRSIPLGNTWYSETRPYSVGDSAVKTCYAIGIKSVIPSFGSLRIERVSSFASVNSPNDESAIIKLDDNWVSACPGGELVAPTTGRRLAGMYPLRRAANASATKEAVFDPTGGVAVHLLRIRKGN